MNESQTIEFPEPKLARFLFGDGRMAWVWLLIRLLPWLGVPWKPGKSISRP